MFFGIISSIILMVLAVAFFYVNLKKSRWLMLRERYPLSAKELSTINSQLSYHIANVNGVHYRNSVFSIINEKGVFIRKPFPFSILLRPLFIPWTDIAEMKIVNSVNDRSTILTNVINKLPFNKFVKIKFLNLGDNFIIIKWKEEYRKKVPMVIQ